MEIIIGILVTCGVVYAVASWLSRATKSLSEKSFSEILDNIDNLAPSQTYLTNKGDSGIAVDEARGKLCLVYGVANIENPVADKLEQETKIYNFNDIMEVQILEDGITNPDISKASQDKVNTGIKRSQKQKVKTVEICIIINDDKNSRHLIKFMEVDRPVEKNNSIYLNALENAVYWQNLLSYLVAKDKEYGQNAPPEKDTDSSYVADELLKLAQLLEKEYITQEEYDSQKAKILKR